MTFTIECLLNTTHNNNHQTSSRKSAKKSPTYFCIIFVNKILMILSGCKIVHHWFCLEDCLRLDDDVVTIRNNRNQSL